MLERLTGLGLGAGFMYFLDPHSGRRRRALLRDQCIHGIHEIETAIDLIGHDLSTRSARFTAEAKAMFSDNYAPDDVIEARIRSALGRVVSHPKALHVVVQDGRAVLTGPILAHEVEHLLEAVNTVRGVLAIENQLEIHRRAEHLPALQGGSTRPGIRHGTADEHGSPTTKVLIGLAGGFLLAQAIQRRRLTTLAASALCLGLTARGLAKTAEAPQNLRGDEPNHLPQDRSGSTGLPGMMSTRVGS